MGFSRPGELFDPLTNGETIGTRSGSTTFLGTRGLRVDNRFSWVRYELAQTLTSGEISVEVEGLQPNGAADKSRIVSMMDNAPNLFRSKFLFNVQYRGVSGNPDNAISYKVLMGDEDLKSQPDFAQRSAGVRTLNPGDHIPVDRDMGLDVPSHYSRKAVLQDRSSTTAATRRQARITRRRTRPSSARTMPPTSPAGTPVQFTAISGSARGPVPARSDSASDK